jgi:hypothetical protein
MVIVLASFLYFSERTPNERATCSAKPCQTKNGGGLEWGVVGCGRERNGEGACQKAGGGRAHTHPHAFRCGHINGWPRRDHMFFPKIYVACQHCLHILIRVGRAPKLFVVFALPNLVVLDGFCDTFQSVPHNIRLCQLGVRVHRNRRRAEDGKGGSACHSKSPTAAMTRSCSTTAITGSCSFTAATETQQCSRAAASGAAATSIITNRESGDSNSPLLVTQRGSGARRGGGSPTRAEEKWVVTLATREKKLCGLMIDWLRSNRRSLAHWPTTFQWPFGLSPTTMPLFSIKHNRFEIATRNSQQVKRKETSSEATRRMRTPSFGAHHC